MSFTFLQLNSVEEMLPNLELLQLLSPKLTPKLYEANLMLMIPNGYAQIVVKDGKTIVAVSGYWILAKLYCGKYLEIDNFIVHPTYQGNGIGADILQWLDSKAKQEKCKVMMLDAYLENHQAHQFYKKHGFEAKGFHFIKKLA